MGLPSIFSHSGKALFAEFIYRYPIAIVFISKLIAQNSLIISQNVKKQNTPANFEFALQNGTNHNTLPCCASNQQAWTKTEQSSQHSASSVPLIRRF